MPPEGLKILQTSTCGYTCLYNMHRCHRDEVKTQPNVDLQMDSNGKPIFGYTERPNGPNFKPSRKSPMKLSQKKTSSVSNDFDVNKIMYDELGVHSLTDHTYKEQQIVEEAVK